MRLVDRDGEVLHERELRSGEPVELWAAVDEEFARDALPTRGPLFLYGYDGDTGDCLGTLIAS